MMCVILFSVYLIKYLKIMNFHFAFPKKGVSSFFFYRENDDASSHRYIGICMRDVFDGVKGE